MCGCMCVYCVDWVEINSVLSVMLKDWKEHCYIMEIGASSFSSAIPKEGEQEDFYWSSSVLEEKTFKQFIASSVVYKNREIVKCKNWISDREKPVVCQI